MSSSFRNSRQLCVAVACAAAAGVALPSSAWGAQTYLQPQIDLRVEGNDNFDLDPNGTPEGNIFGYIADAQVLVGIFTERSQTSLRPRLKFQEYPDRDQMQRLEGFLDLRSEYKWERAEFLLISRYSSEDRRNFETPSGVFDPLDPNYGADPDSVSTLVGETRERFDFDPSFEYAITERMRAGVGLQYRTVSFDADVGESGTDYDYTVVDGSLAWSLTPVSVVSVDAYASQYQADDDSTETDAYGAGFGYRYNWSEVTGLETRLFYENNDVTDYVPVRTEESTSGWGGSMTAYRKLEVSDWRLSISRRFIPTGDGGKSETDQIRMQYVRNLTERLSFEGAARYETRNAITATGGGDDRDYARADLSIEWFINPTWYLKGGYSYVWEDREQASGDADNNKIIFSVGYKGLKRQRR